MLKKIGKTTALVAIALLLMAGVLGASFGQVQGAQKVSFSFSVIGTGSNGTVFAKGVSVSLLSGTGAVLSNSTSTPVVTFNVYPGNYFIYIPSQYVAASGLVYSVYEAQVSINSNGTALSAGQVFKDAYVNYSLVNRPVYVIVKGASVVNSVYVTLPNGLSLTARLVNSSNPNSGYSLKTIAGKQVLNVEYYFGTTVIYSTQFNATSTVNNTIIANVTSSQNVLGTVTSSNGGYVSNIAVSVYKDGELLSMDSFANGYYSISLAPGVYDLVFSSPGFIPTQLNITVVPGEKSIFQPVVLSPIKVRDTETVTFGSGFQTIVIEGEITLANSTTLPFLPYANAGSLYDQLRLNGINRGDLWSILNATVPTSTANTVLYNNYSYNLTGSVTTSLLTGTGGILYQFNFTSSYSQPLITATNNSTVDVYLQRSNSTSPVQYSVEINIPQQYQRANLISSNVADVSGYSGSINISNATTSGFITVKLALKQKPLLNLSGLSATWSGWFESTVISSTKGNYTVLVPVGKQVTLNASMVPYDPVLRTDNYYQMNFTWNIGSGVVMHGYTVEYDFSSGAYPVSLSVASSAGVTNSTNFTIIGDAMNPQLSLNVIQNGVTLRNITASSSTSTVLWVNQTTNVYFNALKSKDLLPSGKSTGLPLSFSWNITGTKLTGSNVSYSFTTPTFNKTDNATLTIENGVGNSFTIYFVIHVNDTTPPIATFQIQNEAGVAVSSVKEYQNVTLNASKSYAPDGGYIKAYNWSISYSNGTVAKKNVEYKIYYQSSNNSTVRLAFIQYGTFSIKLKVTDQSNNTATYTLSLVVNAVGPEIEITKVTYPKSYTEGSPSVLNVTLKNVGLGNATKFYLVVKINGAVVKNQTFTNLTSNGTVNETLTIVPPTSGTYSMVISVYAVGQPTFFNTNTSITKAISIAQAPWKLPALVGGIVVAIGVLAFIYYDITVRRKRPKEPKQQPPKKQLKV
ncbi:MAG: carboxypeptidase regulatory-like domain-containing protein [Thermoplasmatales archaeon]